LELLCIYFLTVGYGKIKFENIFPPPAVQRYETLNKNIQLTWADHPRLREVAASYKILFKVADNVVPYTQKHFTVPKTSVLVPINTNKDYEIFVAYLDDRLGMPGHFVKISCKFERTEKYFKKKAVLLQMRGL
jgi:hypothetical protein